MMSESVPVGPGLPDDRAPGGGWLHFVVSQHHAVNMRHAQRLLRHAAGEIAAWATVVAVAAALLAPIVVFAVAGVWAISTYVSTLLSLWRNVKAYQLNGLSPLLHSLDVAVRVALASAGYFALLAALIVLMAGLLGKRWRRLFLFPGLTFTLPSALAFFFGVRLSLDVLNAPVRTSVFAQTAILAYLLLDVIVLAAALVDVSPRRRRAHHTRGVRWPRLGRRRVPSAPLAPLHFGPSGPLAATTIKLVQAAATTVKLVETSDAPDTFLTEDSPPQAAGFEPRR